MHEVLFVVAFLCVLCASLRVFVVKKIFTTKTLRNAAQRTQSLQTKIPADTYKKDSGYLYFYVTLNLKK